MGVLKGMGLRGRHRDGGLSEKHLVGVQGGLQGGIWGSCMGGSCEGHFGGNLGIGFPQGGVLRALGLGDLRGGALKDGFCRGPQGEYRGGRGLWGQGYLSGGSRTRGLLGSQGSFWGSQG